MDVPTDTEMPDRCTDGPQKTPRHMGCTDVPKSPLHMGNIFYRENIHMYSWYWGYLDVWDVQMYGAYRHPLS